VERSQNSFCVCDTQTQICGCYHSYSTTNGNFEQPYLSNHWSSDRDLGVRI
jgi:hypothetical protein